MRLIDADTLKEAFEEVYPLASNEMGGVVNRRIYAIIDNAPTVPQVTVFAETADEKAVADLKAELQSVIESRQKGEWVQISPAKIYECSLCNKTVMTSDIAEYHYCHGCGADMRGDN